MLTVTNWKSLLRGLTGLTQAEVDNYGLMLLNDGRVNVLSAIDSYITEEPFYANTVAAQQSYAFPVRAFKAEEISVLVGSTVRYTPKIITNARQWNQITIVNSPSSTIPLFVYVDKNKMSFFPTPSASNNQIQAIVTCREADLNGEDAVGGSITATNGSATITGVGTTFLATNVGWKIKLPDNIWYEVDTVASTTSLTLTKLYEGPTTSGANYTLGQTSIIPEEGQMLPVYYAAMICFLSKEKPDKATPFIKLYDKGVASLKDKYGNKTEGQLEPGSVGGLYIRDYNDYPTLT